MDKIVVFFQPFAMKQNVVVYGHKDIYIGMPAIVNSNGARELLELELSEENQAKLDESCRILNENMKKIREAINNK